MYRILFLLSVVLTFSDVELSASNQHLQKARKLFYDAIEDESHIKPAIQLFEKIGTNEVYYGRSLTYIGTLYALKGKHSFSPYNKLKWVIKGLKLMDKGVEESPDDLEALFIHGATCSHLPFFFNREDDAQRSFETIIELLPETADSYDPKLVLHVIDFLEDNMALKSQQQEILTTVKNELTSNEF